MPFRGVPYTSSWVLAASQWDRRLREKKLFFKSEFRVIAVGMQYFHLRQLALAPCPCSSPLPPWPAPARGTRFISAMYVNTLVVRWFEEVQRLMETARPPLPTSSTACGPQTPATPSPPGPPSRPTQPLDTGDANRGHDAGCWGRWRGWLPVIRLRPNGN